MPRGRKSTLDEDVYHIDDDDGGTDSDDDPCDRCDCPRGHHENGKCRCGKCKKFVDPYA